jgi:CheY-like chemotaxis protein
LLLNLQALNICSSEASLLTLPAKEASGLHNFYSLDAPSVDLLQAPIQESDQSSTAAVTTSGILVVDDEMAIRSMLEVALRQQGLAVWSASNGREALDLYQHHLKAVQVILLDVRMPILDGPHTLAALRELNPDIQCCFMSGHSGDYSHESLLQLGAAHVFFKPFKLTEVIHAVEELAARVQSSRG